MDRSRSLPQGGGEGRVEDYQPAQAFGCRQTHVPRGEGKGGGGAKEGRGSVDCWCCCLPDAYVMNNVGSGPTSRLPLLARRNPLGGPPAQQPRALSPVVVLVWVCCGDQSGMQRCMTMRPGWGRRWNSLGAAPTHHRRRVRATSESNGRNGYSGAFYAHTQVPSAATRGPTPRAREGRLGETKGVDTGHRCTATVSGRPTTSQPAAGSSFYSNPTQTKTPPDVGRPTGRKRRTKQKQTKHAARPPSVFVACFVVFLLVVVGAFAVFSFPPLPFLLIKIRSGSVRVLLFCLKL